MAAPGSGSRSILWKCLLPRPCDLLGLDVARSCFFESCESPVIYSGLSGGAHRAGGDVGSGSLAVGQCGSCVSL